MNNLAGLNIGPNNIMDGISNGVFAYNSAFSMQRCTIQNLIANNTNQEEFFGVFAENCAQAQITQCNMAQVTCGIWGDGSNMRADSNNIVTFPNPLGILTNAGIHYINGTGRVIRFRGNNIRASIDGILVSNCWPATNLLVWQNSVDIHPGTSINRTGINLSNCWRGTVSTNTITNGTGTNNYVGIRMTSCNRVTISNNTISNQIYGVYLFGCSNNYLVGNTVLAGGYTGNLASIGFGAFNSADRYCENTTGNQSSSGFDFTGACSQSYLTCNIIGNAADIGLYLWADANNPNIGTRIGPQLNRGNQWTGTYGNWGAYNATNNADLIGQSRFRMPSAQIPSWSTGGGMIGAWFGPGSSINCATACPVEPIKLDDYPGGTDGYFEDGILNDGDISTALGDISGDGLRWMAQQRLYDRLRQYPDMMAQNADVQAFYNSNSMGSMGQLYDIHAQMNEMQQRDPYSQYFLADVQADMLQAFRDLNALQNATNADPMVIRIQQNCLARLMGLYYRYEAATEQQRSIEALGITASNALVTAGGGNIRASNERNLNQIVLENGLWRLKPQPSAVVNAVKAIADQCPIEGGLSVYAARSIYRFFDPAAYWNDENANCFGTNPRSTSKKTAIEGLVVSPNPANHTLALLLPAGLESEADFELLDLRGQLVAASRLPQGQNHATMDTRSLPAGVYFYRLRSNDTALQTGRVVIAH